MRILVTSDLHGLPAAYERFAAALRRYDVGVIAGDNLDQYISDDRLVEMLGLDPDEFLDELPGENDTAEDSMRRWREGRQHEYLEQGLRLREKTTREILAAAGRPILVVPGNHDATPWDSGDNIINIHMRKVEVGGIPFVGYGCLDGGLDAERQMRLLWQVENLVDERTVLVTHFPSYMVLDHDDEGTPGFGSRTLAEMVGRRKPLCHVFGHAHSAFGVRRRSINAAYPEAGRFIALDTAKRRTWKVTGRGRRALPSTAVSLLLS
jgi:Icc-related predicted phosphoesterase